MPKVAVVNTSGKAAGQVELPKEIFAAKVNPDLMAQAVRVYLSNQRKARAKTKTRGEVVGSGRKIWRQKGTGRARHGDRYAPIFVGGGVAHGPTGEENYKLLLPKKMKRRALFSALTAKLAEGELLVVKGLDKVSGKTAEMAKIFKNLKVSAKDKPLIALPDGIENLVRASRNLAGVSLIRAESLNTYQVLNTKRLIFLPESIERLKEIFLKGEKGRKITV